MRFESEGNDDAIEPVLRDHTGGVNCERTEKRDDEYDTHGADACTSVLPIRRRIQHMACGEGLSI